MVEQKRGCILNIASGWGYRGGRDNFMDGYMAARQLRSEAQFAKTYLIALTAYTATVDRTQALLAGFDLHLSKPLRYEDLMQVLNQAKKK